MARTGAGGGGGVGGGVTGEGIAMCNVCAGEEGKGGHLAVAGHAPQIAVPNCSAATMHMTQLCCKILKVCCVPLLIKRRQRLRELGKRF